MDVSDSDEADHIICDEIETNLDHPSTSSVHTTFER